MRSSVLVGAVLSAALLAAVTGVGARAFTPAPGAPAGDRTTRYSICPYRVAAGAEGAASARFRMASSADRAPGGSGRKEDLDANGFRKATDAERKAASTAIEAQLKAFQNDDYATAEKYQSSGLRDNFPSRDVFRKMMREHYPQFANYKSVTFGEARADEKGDVVEIQAAVTGRDKVTIKAVYVMVKEEGQFRVASVYTPAQQKQNPRDII